MSEKNRRISGALVICFLLFFGYFLYGAPAEIGRSVEWRNLIGAFLIFCFTLAGFQGAGALAQRLFELKGPGPLLALALGTALASLLISLLGSLGSLGPSFQPLFLICLLGFSLLPLLWKDGTFPIHLLPTDLKNRTRAPWWTWLVGVLLTIHLLYLFYETFIPHPFWDPLYYALPAVKSWSDSGRIFLDANHPAHAHSASWEYLFLWGSSLLTDTGSGGLIALQAFGQWTHYLGLLGSLGCVGWLFRRFGLQGCWLGLAVFSSFWFSNDTSSLRNIARYAKNDWGSVFWALSGLVLLVADSGRRIQTFLAGILLGMSVGAKFVTLYFLIPIFLLWLPWRGTNVRRFALISCGVILGMAPILLRNWFFTGNPVFPAFASIFGEGLLSDSWIEGLKFFQPGDSTDRQVNGWKLFLEFLTQNPFSGFTFLGFYTLLRSSRFQDLKPALALWSASITAFLLFIFSVGSSAELRLLGPAAVLLNAFGVFFIARILVPLAPRLFLASALLCAIAVSANPGNWWRTPYELTESLSPSDFLYRKYRFGPLLAWASTQNLAPGQVGSIDENRLFYLEPLLGAVRIWDRPELDRQLNQARSMSEVVSTLRGNGFQYLLTARVFLDPYYNRRIRNSLLETFARYPKAIVFDNEWQVIHLETLAELLKPDPAPSSSGAPASAPDTRTSP